MKSKGVIIAIVIVLVLAVVGLFFVLNKPGKEVSPLSKSPAEENSIPTIAPKPPVETMMTLKDEAGFLFAIPTVLVLTSIQRTMIITAIWI